MPVRSKAIEAGIFRQEELELLSRVMTRSARDGEDEEQRSARASRIIGYFQMGVADEDELVTLARQALGR